MSIEQLIFQKLPNIHNIYRPKTVNNDYPTLQPVFKVHRRIMESVYSTIQSAHSQCAAGMQTISDSDAAATVAEWGHFKHSL